MKKSKKRISKPILILLAALAIAGLIGIGAYLDSRTIENPRHIIDGDRKIYCEELYYGTTRDGISFQICLPMGKASFRDSIVLLNGKRTNTLDGGRLLDGGTTNIQTGAGTFYFPVPNSKGAATPATFENEPLLVWHKK